MTVTWGRLKGVRPEKEKEKQLCLRRNARAVALRHAREQRLQSGYRGPASAQDYNAMGSACVVLQFVNA